MNWISGYVLAFQSKFLSAPPYLHFEVSGSDTILHVSSTGVFGDNNAIGTPSSTLTNNEVQKIVLTGVDLTLGGTLTTDQAVIQDLLTKGKLYTD